MSTMHSSTNYLNAGDRKVAGMDLEGDIGHSNFVNGRLIRLVQWNLFSPRIIPNGEEKLPLIIHRLGVSGFMGDVIKTKSNRLLIHHCLQMCFYRLAK